MYHRIERIVGKPGDYKVCLNCGYVNWYERVACISCDRRRFRRTSKGELKRLFWDWEDWEAEVEV